MRTLRLTKEQRKALHKVWLRGSNNGMSYREFRRTVFPLIGGSGCIMVKWCGMYLGIERDGYTHS